MSVAGIPRAEWLASYFAYEPGQHLGAFERTQGGKTWLLWQCMNAALAQEPSTRAAVLMPKSRSPATRLLAERYGFKIIDRWPPPPRWPGQSRPRGYVLWPPHLAGVPVKDNRQHLAAIFRRCLNEQFRNGESLTLADDIYNLAALLELNPELEEHLTAGAEGGASLWGAMQKTSGTRDGGTVTTFLYNNIDHVLLGYEAMPENRKRFDSIGFADPRMVDDIVSTLPRHSIETPHGIKNISDKLHIDMRGYMCVVQGL